MSETTWQPRLSFARIGEIQARLNRDATQEPYYKYLRTEAADALGEQGFDIVDLLAELKRLRTPVDGGDGGEVKLKGGFVPSDIDQLIKEAAEVRAGGDYGLETDNLGIAAVLAQEWIVRLCARIAELEAEHLKLETFVVRSTSILDAAGYHRMAQEALALTSPPSGGAK